MAGHSKWANIKHRKAAQDAKRAKVWTRIIRELTIASREGGDDPDSNPRLRLAIQNAKGSNVPKETIERAIKKGAGGEGENLQEQTYEGYASNGIAVFVEATTDNINRTVANVRAVFNKYGGELGKNGSLGFLFDRKGVFSIEIEPLEIQDREEFEMALIDGGLEEIEWDDDNGLVTLYCAFEDFGSMQKQLENLKVSAKNAEVQRIPNNTTALDVEQAKKVLTLIEMMEEDDDVSNVYHNLEMTEDLMAALTE